MKSIVWKQSYDGVPIGRGLVITVAYDNSQIWFSILENNQKQLLLCIQSVSDTTVSTTSTSPAHTNKIAYF